MSGENYRSATKSHDPGWNDPPKLSYAPGASPGQTTKLNLNKRVAFPLANSGSPKPAIGNLPPPMAMPPLAGGTSSLPQFVPVTSGPPPPIAAVPPTSNSIGTAVPPPLPPATAVSMLVPPSVESTADTPAAVAAQAFPDNAEMMEFVRVSLAELLSKTEGSKQAEIQKRLDVMQRSWNDGKLGEGLRQKLYRLVSALNETKVVEATELHRSIIVDHGKDCVQWAPALRQLIQAVPRPQEPTEGEDSLANGILKPI